MKSWRKSIRGFTLIELLVVIAIIGYLSVIGMTQLYGAREIARDARRQSDLAEIRLALSMYESDQGRYPIPVANGATGPDISSAASVAGTIFDNVDGGNPLVKEYMAGRFIDPINTPALYYTYDTSNGSHTAYRLCAVVEGRASAGQFLVLESSGEFSIRANCNPI
ncbi:MAG: type II secretion system protein [Parcubacteria group bacterium]